MFAHQLQYQTVFFQITQFVAVFNMKGNNTLQTRLGDGFQKTSGEVLSEQHTEIRGVHGRLLVLRGDIGQRQGSTCGEENTILFAVVFYSENQLVRLRLNNLCQMAAGEGVIQFTANICYGNTIKCHVFTSNEFI